MVPNNVDSPVRRRRLRSNSGVVAAFAVIFLVVWRLPPHDLFRGLAGYDPLHVMLETLSIVVAGLVFGVVWNADNRERAGNIVVLACALLAAAIVDFMHMMSFAGMPDLVTPAGPEKAINFWLAARFIVAAALLWVALHTWRPFRRSWTRYLWLGGALLLAGLIVWLGLYHQALFPRTFIPGRGLTPVKIGAEYAIIALLVPSALLFLRGARRGAPYDAASMFAAAVISILSELSFTLYSNVTDSFNLLGHLYKVAAYIFIFRAVFIESVREPFARLHEAQTELQQALKALRESEEQLRTITTAAQDGIVMMDDSGAIVFWNQAAERIFGYPASEAVGQPLHQVLAPSRYQEVFHTGLGHFAATGSGPVFGKTLELTALRKDGSEFPMELSVSAVQRAGHWNVIGVLRDITERKRADATLRKLNRTLTTLSHGNEALVRTADETSLLQAVCEVLVRDGMYLMTWVGYVVEETGDRLRVMARSGDGGSFREQMPVAADGPDGGDCPGMAAVRTGRVQVEQDLAANANLAPCCKQIAARHINGVAAFPLTMQGRVFGALVVYAGSTDAFDASEVGLLQELTGDLSYGIEMLRTQVERDRMREDLKTALSGTIEAVARMVEKRDPYTAGHQQRVAELAAAIAGEMGLAPQRIEGIRLGGLIHDIGKISIPAEILSRPGRLAPVEFEIVKSHAQIGYDIIKDVHFPWPVADMVWQHHERLDGSGYPQGLTGEQITQEARILAVADVVEAMASHRPYRPGLGSDAALEEIERGRGRLYCPEAVDACLRLFRERHFRWTVGDH